MLRDDKPGDSTCMMRLWQGEYFTCLFLNATNFFLYLCTRAAKGISVGFVRNLQFIHTIVFISYWSNSTSFVVIVE